MGTTLAARWKKARGALHANELDRRIGEKLGVNKGGTTSRIERGERANTGLDVVSAAAEATGVRPAWLAFEDGPMHGADVDARVASLRAVTALSRLLRFNNLIAAVENSPEKGWTLWHVATAVRDVADQSDRSPEEWAALLDKIARPEPPQERIAAAVSAEPKRRPRKRKSHASPP